MRHNEPFPREDTFIFEFTKYIWEQGWLDDFSENHFFIKAINNTLTDFKYIDYYRNNNSWVSIPDFDPFSPEMDVFNETFVINFSKSLQQLCNYFGEEEIKKFVQNQLSAGKKNYDENIFFQAVSEVSILVFLGSFVLVTKSLYEPVAGKKKHR